MSGQHEEVIVVRAGGKVELVDTEMLGFPVGVGPEIAEFVAEVSLKLEVGDGIVLYTDGFTEAENINREFYGLERLCQVASQNWTKSAEGVRQAIVEDVRAYIGQQTIYDDLALVVVKQI
jgi:serine phosphatase RsbU (regulator of sigma subunit)